MKNLVKFIQILENNAKIQILVYVFIFSPPLLKGQGHSCRRKFNLVDIHRFFLSECFSTNLFFLRNILCLGTIKKNFGVKKFLGKKNFG